MPFAGLIAQLRHYFEYFQCGISLEHKFALNQDHLRNFRLLQLDDAPMSLIENEEPSSVPARQNKSFGWLKRYQHFLFPIAGIAIALLAIYILENLLQNTSRKDTLEAFHAISWTTIGLAVFFTMLSYAAVALYDVVAVDTIAPNQIPRRIAAVAGAAGYAISMQSASHF